MSIMLPQRMRVMAFPRAVDLHKLAAGALYLAGYAAFEWISFIGPYAHFGITPWNPGTGLSFALLLLLGLRMAPLLFVSPLLADWLNQQLTMPWQIEVATAVLIGGGYSLAVAVLLRPALRFAPALTSVRDLVLLAAAAVAGAAAVAVGYVGLAVAAGQLPAADFAAAALHYWVGDVIGIMVIAPVTLFALTRRHLLPPTAATALQFLAIALALGLVFGFPQAQQLQLFYLVFLPIVWLAAAGSEAVSVGLLLTQLGLILGLRVAGADTVDVTAFQALMLVLALTGLVVGELVTERRRTETQLRLQQEQLARVSRLGSMGELAAAVAHELNQPLMAAGTYTRLLSEAIGAAECGDSTMAETARKAAAQVERAADVMRRLRALVRLDRSNRAPCSFDRIAAEAIELCRADMERAQIAVRAIIPSDLPIVTADLLQIEQVLINLLRNAGQAIAASGRPRGSVSIEAKRCVADFVEVSVLDSGPGFSPQLAETAFLPLSTTKAEGLGIGLPLCRTIVEAHGGKIWLDAGAKGGAIRFTLPIVAS